MKNFPGRKSNENKQNLELAATTELAGECSGFGWVAEWPTTTKSLKKQLERRWKLTDFIQPK